MDNNAYGTPVLLTETQSKASEMVAVNLESDPNFKYNEDWLQEKITEHPKLLPVNEVDPIFGELIPVYREMMTPVGPLDNLFINEQGLLTLVECKLWRNPEARRKVVGQILDYAQEFSRMSYDELNRQIARKTKVTGENALFEIVADTVEGLNEGDFTDKVMKNLRLGRFLLLIVGDGIRESVEQISEYLQQHAHLNFTFALVEQRLFKLRNENEDMILIQPRILAKTTSIERGYIRLEDERIGFAAPKKETDTTGKTSATRGGNLTEQSFYEHIKETDPQLCEKLNDLFKELNSRGITMDWKRSGVGAKNNVNQFNFLFFEKQGTIRNYGCANTKEGMKYLEKLSKLFEDSDVSDSADPFRSTIAKKDGSAISVNELFSVKEEWFKLIEEYQTSIEN